MSTKENAYYSRTSKDPVVVPDSVWKQILSPEVYAIARQKGTERPLPVPMKPLRPLALITVKHVAILYSKVIPNLIVDVVGLVFMSPLPNNLLFTHQITPMVW